MLNPRVCYEFKVEKIIGISNDGNYQVQYAPAWVSKFHLVGCEHLIQEFLQQQQCELSKQVELQNQPEHSTSEAEKIDWETVHKVTQNETNERFTLETEVKKEPVDENIDSSPLKEKFAVSNDFDPPDFEDHQSSSNIQVYSPLTDEDISPPSKFLEPYIETQSSNRQKDDDLPHGSGPEPRLLKIQWRKQLTDRLYKCTLCSKSFSSHSKLSTHNNRIHRESMFNCTHCEFTCSMKSAFIIHLRTHAKEFKCDECGSAFSQKGNLAQHKRIHSGEQPYKCEHCGQRFTFFNQRRRHMNRCCNS